MYLVTGVDPSDGTLKLIDEEWQHLAMSNFITGTRDHGARFKIPPARGNWVFKPTVDRPLPKLQEDKPKETNGLRRVYVTHGMLHTRIKGIAYAPDNETQAKDGDRLETKLVGMAVRVKHPENGWEEVWQRKQEQKTGKSL